jgi:NADH-quinone oxidoreductase subunit F
MPSHEWEIREAIAEGVEVNPSWGPVKILGDGNGVTGVEFVRCKSVFDENKKFNPVFDEKTKQVAEADMVIPAIGQSPDLSYLGNLVETARGAVTVDPRTMQTSLPGVFAGGDSVSGTASLIEAIVAGRTAAASVIRYLEHLK